MSARIASLYVTTEDKTSKSHTYRLPVTDTVPDGEEITAVRPAGLFRLSSVLSPESRTNLQLAVSHKR
jgi:hypothetical protein